eukprot:CAMPEP_0116948704 /NCGR_PEP_ID=MMETSP0467-20121206/38487_1 /TAXON_ID=283647 /ORGANISM="Mesodinium pulex, Strain SPMC105" /LENGTH=82 /DNA_ID=CAMNT_0004633219 /DNA_START=309 /DNA_END=557 /DNA_ORIENTATION=-
MLLKKVFWNDKNISFNLATTLVFRICIIDLFKIIEERIAVENNGESVEITNKFDIVNDLCKLSMRSNDTNTETPDEAENKPV